MNRLEIAVFTFMFAEPKLFVCQYRYDDRWWIVHIHADGWEDAKSRAIALGGLEVLGELGGSIPAVPTVGLISRVIVTIKNVISAFIPKEK